MYIAEHTSKIIKLKTKPTVLDIVLIVVPLFFGLFFGLPSFVGGAILLFDGTLQAFLSGVFTMLVGGFFVLFGMAFVVSKRLVSCTFNKNSGKVSMKHQNMLFQSEIIEKRLDEIKMANFDETADSDGDLLYETKLTLRSGESISLCWSKN